MVDRQICTFGRYLTVRQAAVQLGVSHTHIHKLLRSGQLSLAHRDLSKTTLVNVDDVEKMAALRAGQPPTLIA